jgi:hypothetical protein
MSNTYDVGTKAWQPDSTEGWVASEVTAKQVDGDKVTLVFALANGEVSGYSLWSLICQQQMNREHTAKDTDDENFCRAAQWRPPWPPLGPTR